MIQLRRASVIATLSLLASAATASAECAWVLWESQQFYAKDGAHLRGAWVLDRAFGTEERCRAQLRPVATIDASPSDAAAKVMIRPVCLPDTVDPRGPKGGGG